MAYVISSDCVSCGACEGACPVSAISQGDEHYEIDAGTCIDCGTRAAVFPVAKQGESWYNRGRAIALLCSVRAVRAAQFLGKWR